MTLRATVIEDRAPRGLRLADTPGVTVEIGTIAISLRSSDADFLRMLADRYSGFVNEAARPDFVFDVRLTAARAVAGDEELSVARENGCWRVERGDFSASWDSAACRGWIRQSANPYSADTLLRIVHSIALAEKGGFLVHAASAVRNGRAFVFAGVSGAGKTTLTRLAPPDTHILTDEISYVVKEPGGYRACGTPFAGEFARVGENITAPVAGLFLLRKADCNKLLEIDRARAFSALMRNILFLTQDDQLVRRVFHAAAELVSAVPIRAMQFTRDERAWETIQ